MMMFCHRICSFRPGRRHWAWDSRHSIRTTAAEATHRAMRPHLRWGMYWGRVYTDTCTSMGSPVRVIVNTSLACIACTIYYKYELLWNTSSFCVQFLFITMETFLLDHPCCRG